ncbi:MAG TPA: type II secretion system protein [Actinomycetota bacterium]|nr:type II secretion system protein [Actinomycetota bacterium]
MKNQRGFTLIELLTVMLLTSVLVTLGVPALRNFWFVRALESGRQEVESQLRRQQQRVVAETHPLVYGIRFPRRDGGSSRINQIGVVQFNGNDLTTDADDTCRLDATIDLPTGVEIGRVETDFGDPDVTEFCREELSSPDDHFVFFFARGNANSARVHLIQTKLNDRENVLCVSAVTARVYEVDPSEPC